MHKNGLAKMKAQWCQLTKNSRPEDFMVDKCLMDKGVVEEEKESTNINII